MSFSKPLECEAHSKRGKFIPAEDCFERASFIFSAISVREKETVSLLSDLVSLPVEYVLDPTLLITNEEWGSLASRRLIDKPYVLCYFLGNSANERRLAQEYANAHGLITVNIRNATAQYHSSDIGFSDTVLDAPSPKDFLSLIKNAEFVFTDSFHATAFSFIFQRQFFVFERQNHDSMGTRIKSFLDLLSIPERFCFGNDRLTIDYIQSLQDINYFDEFDSFKKMQNKSLLFLKNALQNAELLVKEDVVRNED